MVGHERLVNVRPRLALKGYGRLERHAVGVILRRKLGIPKSVLLQLLLLQLQQLELLLVLESLKALHFTKQFFCHRYLALWVIDLEDLVQVGLVFMLRKPYLLSCELELL